MGLRCRNVALHHALATRHHKFLSSRPSLPYASIDAIYKDGRYHKNLDLIDDIMTGPAHPDEDPELLSKARREGSLSACRRQNHGRQPADFSVLSTQPSTTADARRTSQRVAGRFSLSDQHAHRRPDLVAVDLLACRFHDGGSASGH